MLIVLSGSVTLFSKVIAGILVLYLLHYLRMCIAHDK